LGRDYHGSDHDTSDTRVLIGAHLVIFFHPLSPVYDHNAEGLLLVFVEPEVVPTEMLRSWSIKWDRGSKGR